jgi:hypothetical protein
MIFIASFTAYFEKYFGLWSSLSASRLQNLNQKKKKPEITRTNPEVGYDSVELIGHKVKSDFELVK